MTTTDVQVERPPRGRRPTSWRRLLLTWLALPLSALAALLIGALLIIAFGANPLTGYHALLSGAFGGSYALASTAQKAVPLLLVAVGICVAVRASVWNIGGEGQIVMGALASTATALALPNLPALLLIPLVVVAAAAGGAAWAGIAGFFKAYEHSWLPTIVSGTQLNLGVVIAVAVAIAGYLLLWRTGFGFRIRAVGLSRDAAAYSGMPVKRTIMSAMVLSGACCGIAGAVLVFGSISHRMVTDGSLTGFTGNDGFNGIVVALFGGLNPLWSVLSAYLFGGLLVGGTSMQAVIGVPTDLVTTIEGLVVIFVVSIDYLRARSRIQEEAQRLGQTKQDGPGGTGRSLLIKLARARP